MYYDEFSTTWRAMKPSPSHVTVPIYLRAPLALDWVVEEIARRERRTKSAVLAISLEEYARQTHGDLHAEYARQLGEHVVQHQKGRQE